MGSLADLVDKSERKIILKNRKSAFERIVEEESYQIRCDDIIIMKINLFKNPCEMKNNCIFATRKTSMVPSTNLR